MQLTRRAATAYAVVLNELRPSWNIHTLTDRLQQMTGPDEPAILAHAARIAANPKYQAPDALLFEPVPTPAANNGTADSAEARRNRAIWYAAQAQANPPRTLLQTDDWYNRPPPAQDQP